ncbi:hypothetical protein BH10ACT7_BH10ACT7_03990 [soil metagenome]
MTERNPDPNIDIENPDNTEDQLDAEEAVTSEDITDTEFGEDPDIEVPDTDA